MAFAKWIGGFVGLYAGGILGALAGYCIGSVVDSLFSSSSVEDGDSQYEFSDQQLGQRNGFLFSLLLLSAHIIMADGKIMHSEMDFVRRFLRQNFGESAVQQGEDILKKLFEYRKQYGESKWKQDIASACNQLAMQMPSEQRLQLIAYLAEIAKADGNVAQSEILVLREIAVNMAVNASVIDQMLSLGKDTIDDAYKVLGISPDATNDEVRAAYRKMALQYHPDKVATLGEDVKEAANRKFQEINAAKEKIYKERNM